MGQDVLQTLQRIEKLLQARNLNEKEVLSVDEACIYLDLSDSHLYKLTSAREIPFFKPHGKKLYFNRKELDRWMQSNRMLTNDEVESKASSYMVVNM